MLNPERRKLRSAPLVTLVAGIALIGLFGCRERKTTTPPPPVVPPPVVDAPLPPPVNPPALTWTEPTDPQWAAIDQLEAERKFHEAAAEVEALRERAEAAGQQEAWAKALVRQTRYRIDQPEPGRTAMASFATAVRQLREARWPAARLPRLFVELFYARSLLRYLDQNGYEIGMRERIVAGTQFDLSAWTGEQIFAEAARALGRLWEERAALGGTPVSGLASVLTPNNYPPDVRGTLRDALTYQVVDILTDTRYWQPEESADLYRLDFDALRRGEPRAALADLESWHARSNRPAAALEARLVAVGMLHQGFGGKFAHDALRADLEQRLAAPELRGVAWSAMGRVQLARMVRSDQNDLPRARALAAAAAQEFPDSAGGKEGARLVAEIDAPVFSLAATQVDGEGQRSLCITHRNTAALYFRAYAVDFRQRIPTRLASWSLPDSEEAATILYGDPARHLLPTTPVAEWQVPLAATADFQSHQTFAKVPIARRGLYLIASSYRPDFAREDNQVHTVNFQRSELALVTHQDDSGDIAITVVEAATGSPARGAKVQVYGAGAPGFTRFLETRVVDASGSVRLAARPGISEVAFWAERGDDRIIKDDTLGLYRDDETKQARTDLIYTDRPVYRPQQKLYFKVVPYIGSTTTGRFRLYPKQPITVWLYDANYQRIDHRELVTNAFGTAAGEFTLPAGRLLGSWSVRSDKGSTHVQVEEYKRPTFAVTLQAPKDALRLDRPAVITGAARYYFGLPVAHGSVRYRVTRQWVIPAESKWDDPYPLRKVYPDDVEPVTVARGEAPLQADGTFQVTFTPQAVERPGLVQAPLYAYELTADLTDEGGETRSASRAYRVGLVAVRAALSADFGFLVAGATRGVVKVLRQDLDGSPLAGAGSYKLVRLAQPKVAELPSEVPLPEPSPGAAPQLVLPGDRQRLRGVGEYAPESLLASWADGATIKSDELAPRPTGESTIALPALTPGPYRLRYETKDAFGTPYTATKEFLVASETQGAETAVALALEVEQSTLRVGQRARFLVHSGFADQTIYFERYRAGTLVARQVLSPAGAEAAGATPRILELPIGEADRGGFTVQAFVVRDHQYMALRRSVKVPWDNMELKLSFASFRDTLRPGGTEKWRIAVHAADGKTLAAGAAELLTLMYDRSLDLFAPFAAPLPMTIFPDRTRLYASQSSCGMSYASALSAQPLIKIPDAIELHGDSLNRVPVFDDGPRSRFGGQRRGSRFKSKLAARKASRGEAERKVANESTHEVDALYDKADESAATENRAAGERLASAGSSEAAAPSLAAPPDSSPRTNFAETAFFFPQLLTDGDSGVAFEFTVPESNTSWRVWAQALSRTMQSGTIEAQARTVKELMVRPYLPRFLREGDRADLRVVVNNAGATPYDGTLELAVIDADSREPRTAQFGVTPPSQSFHVEPGQGTTVSFPLLAPNSVGLYGVRVTARAGDLSDGELRPLPVLPSRMHLVQSKFVALREPGTRTIAFADMKKNDDPTRLQEQLVVTLDAQLFYTALKALPYLVSYPYEGTEQTLNRFLSTGIVSSLFLQHPEVGRAAAALAQDRKTVVAPLVPSDPNRQLALEESPWLSAASAEQLLRVLDPEVARATRDAAQMKLRKAQLASGGFPWFAGGPASPPMTLYLASGFARAAEFQVPLDRGMAVRAWQYLGRHFRDEYAKHLGDGQADPYFLVELAYAASTFPNEKLTGGALRPEEFAAIVDYTFARAAKLPPLLRAQLALTLKRAGREQDARTLMASILDASKTDPDFGTYFAPEGQPWMWYGDTIESHAAILRALIEIDPKNAKKDGLVLWLLVNKKLNQWKSTRATAEVLYTLAQIMKQEGTLRIKEEALVRAGAVEQRFAFLPSRYVGKAQLVIPAAQIDPAQTSTITIEKTSPGVMFASATWHFSTAQLPLQGVGDLFQVERRYFKRTHNGKEFVLTPIAEGAGLVIGDELEVQLTVRSKQAAEYVHLRDPRAAGLEPERATSGYRWDIAAGAYEEVRDSGANYFFERLPAGEYVLKYRLRASLAGAFRVGPATIQSMYAPEFAGYSAGQLLKIVTEPSAQ